MQDGNNFFPNTYRPPSPFYLSQDMNNGYYTQYSTMSLERMTPSPLSLQTNKVNPIKSTKPMKTGMKIALDKYLFLYKCRFVY